MPGPDFKSAFSLFAGQKQSTGKAGGRPCTYLRTDAHSLKKTAASYECYVSYPFVQFGRHPAADPGGFKRCEPCNSIDCPQFGGNPELTFVKNRLHSLWTKLQ